MNLINIYRSLFAGMVTFILMSTTSCEKFVEVDPTDRAVTKEIFSDSINATAAILGVYTSMIQDPNSVRISNGGVSVTTALAGDELFASGATSDPTQFFQNAISPASNNWNSAFLWKTGFEVIYKANACLEALNEATQLSETLKNRLQGEMLFVRSFMYYHLINLYGDVPFIEGISFQTNATKPRDTFTRIVDKSIEDLRKAKTLLSYQYPSDGRQRPNKAAVQCLLSKLLLYKNSWNEIENEMTEVINQPSLSLVELEKVFTPGNSESIWQMDPIVEGVETAEGVALLPAGTTVIPKYLISPILNKAFELGDRRKEVWVGKNIVNSNGVPTTYYYPKKYRLGRDKWTGVPLESYSYFRLAEVILLRAEARAKLGKITGAGSAIEDINLIRRRASLTDTTIVGNEQILDILFHEKQVEMFCEWGTRWYDLKRTGKLDQAMTEVAALKGRVWNKNFSLFPIPSAEIVLNPKLTQNEGYPQ